MRILNIMLAHVKGGVETMSLRYHEALRQTGIEVVSAGHSDGELARGLPPEQFRAVNAIVNHDPLAALRIRALARDFRPDLVLTHGNRATGICLLPFVGTADKTVQVVHNFRHKGQLGRARAAICVSRSVHDSVRAANPGLPVFEVPNFGPLSERPVKPAPKGVPVIGTLGRLHVNKGLDVMLRALALLPDIRLRIAGDGPERAALETLTAELNVADRVDFCGWVQAADYLHGLDLFVLSSRVEPFGLVVTEAMAAGVPVVATRIDGPREILLDGQLGVLCDNGNPEALATAVRTTIGDWPAALKRAVTAQHYALTHFSLEAGARRLSVVVAEITQKT